jgi:hypothetical protein
MLYASRLTGLTIGRMAKQRPMAQWPSGLFSMIDAGLHVAYRLTVGSGNERLRQSHERGVPIL